MNEKQQYVSLMGCRFDALKRRLARARQHYGRASSSSSTLAEELERLLARERRMALTIDTLVRSPDSTWQHLRVDAERCLFDLTDGLCRVERDLDIPKDAKRPPVRRKA